MALCPTMAGQRVVALCLLMAGQRVMVEGFNEGLRLNAQDTLSCTGLIWACLISFCNGFFLGFKNLDRVIIHNVHNISGFPDFLPEGRQ